MPLSALSDGYQNVAAWCGDLLYRITTAFDDYKNPLHVRGLLILDEIDLHLHPVWQRKLREFIDNKLPNMQVLATTHSPMTAQQSGEGELFHIQRKDGGPPVIEQFQGAPNKMYLHQLVASPMFGIETLASRELEQQREEYDKLNTLPSPNPKQKKRLKAVKADLDALPDLTPNALQVPDSELVRDVLNFLSKK